MTPTTEVTTPITLDKPRLMRFNANTMCAYEEVTGKFFLDTVASLHAAMRPYLEYRIKAAAADKLNASGKPVPPPPRVSSMDVIRKISLIQLRALLWASLHEYNKDGEPVWPLTIGKVGRLLKPTEVMNVFTLFLLGQTANTPTDKELGESKARPKTSEETAPTTDESGGEPGIALPPDAFPSAI